MLFGIKNRKNKNISVEDAETEWKKELESIIADETNSKLDRSVASDVYLETDSVSIDYPDIETWKDLYKGKAEM